MGCARPLGTVSIDATVRQCILCSAARSATPVPCALSSHLVRELSGRLMLCVYPRPPEASWEETACIRMPAAVGGRSGPPIGTRKRLLQALTLMGAEIWTQWSSGCLRGER